MLTKEKHKELIYHQIINEIESDIDNNIDSFTLSEKLNCKHFLLKKIFEEKTNYSLDRFLKQRILTNSAIDLIITDIPVNGIADRYNFVSHQSYTRAFTSQFGIPPDGFRKRNILSGSQLTFPLLTTRIPVEIRSIEKFSPSEENYGYNSSIQLDENNIPFHNIYIIMRVISNFLHSFDYYSQKVIFSFELKQSRVFGCKTLDYTLAVPKQISPHRTAHKIIQFSSGLYKGINFVGNSMDVYNNMDKFFNQLQQLSANDKIFNPSQTHILIDLNAKEEARLPSSESPLLTYYFMVSDSQISAVGF